MQSSIRALTGQYTVNAQICTYICIEQLWRHLYSECMLYLGRQIECIFNLHLNLILNFLMDVQTLLHTVVSSAVWVPFDIISAITAEHLYDFYSDCM
jgi:hypothetical protein